MRIAKLIGTVGILIIMVSCLVTSIHPLYTGQDSIYKPELEGTWYNDEEKSQLTFEKSEKNTYTMIYTEKETSGQFKVSLVKLDTNLFLDIYPQQFSEKNEFLKLHFIPAHSFAQIWIEQNNLRFAILNYQWLKENVEKGKIKISHEIEDDSIILTASTAELQKFIKKYAGTPDVFPEPITYTRQTEAAPNIHK